MEWMLINAWVEKHAGVSYDVNQHIEECRSNMLLLDPYSWKAGMDDILVYLEEVVSLIHQNRDQIPDALIGAKELEKTVIEYVIDKVRETIHEKLDLMNITNIPLDDLDTIRETINVVYEMIYLVLNCPEEDYDKEFHRLDTKVFSGNLMDVYKIHENDLPGMRIKLNAIKNSDVVLTEYMQ
jgi:hypothetical protein